MANQIPPTSTISSLAQPVPARSLHPRWLHVILFAVALIGWATFMIACVGGPAWSPDGSKIIFGYYDEQNSRVALALYDASKHKVSNVFAAPASKDDDTGIIGIVSTWQADGRRALIALTADVPSDGDGHCSLVSIPVKSEVPIQVYMFGKSAVCWSSALIVQIGDTIYLSGDDGLMLLNLVTGQIESKSIPGGAQFIAEHNGHLVYVRGINRPAPTPKDKDAVEDGLEFGQVDLADFQLKPFHSIWEADFDDISALRDAFGGSWEPGGTRIAVIVEGSDFDRIVLLDENKGFVTSFVPDLGVKKFHLGMPVWSHDGKSLYVPAVSPADKEKQYTYSLAEIPIAGTAARLTHIADFEWTKSDDLSGILYLGLQVSLAPNGKTIAATTASLGAGAAAADRVLFLIDLSRPDRHITRVSPPRIRKSH